MSEQLADKFIEALKDLEQNKNIETIAGLFDDSSEIGNVSLTENLKGQEGAREFWKSYRESFDDVSSTFHNKIIDGNVIALEWTTEFNRQQGENSTYRGVSIIESDGDRITRFYAYFNPHDLAEQLTETAEEEGD